MLPEEYVLDEVRDLFPWPEEEPVRTQPRGAGSGPTGPPGAPAPGQEPPPLTRRVDVESLRIGGVFWSGGAHRVLVDSQWLGEGDTYRGLTVVSIAAEGIVLSSGDEEFVLAAPEPEILLFLAPSRP